MPEFSHCGSKNEFLGFFSALTDRAECFRKFINEIAFTTDDRGPKRFNAFRGATIAEDAARLTAGLAAI